MSDPALEAHSVVLLAGGSGHSANHPHAPHPGCWGTHEACFPPLVEPWLGLPPEHLEQLSGTGACHQCPTGIPVSVHTFWLETIANPDLLLSGVAERCLMQRANC